MTITPAYGRDYKSAAALKADWDAGRDFQLHHLRGTIYVSKRDADEIRKNEGISALQARYNKLSRVTIINL